MRSFILIHVILIASIFFTINKTDASIAMIIAMAALFEWWFFFSAKVQSRWTARYSILFRPKGIDTSFYKIVVHPGPIIMLAILCCYAFTISYILPAAFIAACVLKYFTDGARVYQEALEIGKDVLKSLKIMNKADGALPDDIKAFFEEARVDMDKFTQTAKMGWISIRDYRDIIATIYEWNNIGHRMYVEFVYGHPTSIEYTDSLISDLVEYSKALGFSIIPDGETPK